MKILHGFSIFSSALISLQSDESINMDYLLHKQQICLKILLLFLLDHEKAIGSRAEL